MYFWIWSLKLCLSLGLSCALSLINDHIPIITGLSYDKTLGCNAQCEVPLQILASMKSIG